MKQLLMTSIISLVTGFCFVGGSLLAVSLFEEDNRSKRTYVDEPQGFEFIKHQRISNKDNFTVKGIIKNTSDTEWDNVQIFLKIYAGDAYMTYCQKSYDYVAPTSERPFTIVCSDIPGDNIPGNITYKLSVTRAVKKE